MKQDGEPNKPERPVRSALRFVDSLPPLMRYKVLVYIGCRNRRRGNFETARIAFERAAVLFPDRKEVLDLLDEIRQKLGGTAVFPQYSDLVLPLHRSRLDAKGSHPIRGTMTGNLWRIDERLGAGAGKMGEVFRARNLAVVESDDFAIKTYVASLSWDQRITRQFQKEALTWIRLGRHPNVVHAFWVERLEGALCVVMEYVPGKDLKQQIRRGPFSPARALPLALNLCDALLYARALGIVHRDVKPENCLLTRDGTLKLADFGISTTLRRAESDILGGTQPYGAPEQWDPTADVDERADIHAFGIMLGEMLAGKLLNSDEIAHGLQRGALAGPLWELVLWCVNEDRERRPENLDELRHALEVCHTDLLKTVAPPPSPPPKPTSDDYKDNAAAFISLGENTLAIEAYRHALQMRTDDPALWAGLTAAHIKAGDFNAAVETASQGIQLCGRTASLLNNKGDALAKAGRGLEGLQYLDEALNLDSANPMVLCNRAEVLWNLNDRSQALRVCDAALANDPRFVRALILKANILVDEQRINEAYEELQKAAQIDPHDSEVLFGLSCTLDLLGRPNEARGYIDAALERNQGNLAMLRHKGWLLLKLSMIEGAIVCLDEVLAQDPQDVEALRGKGLALLTIGQRG